MDKKTSLPDHLSPVGVSLIYMPRSCVIRSRVRAVVDVY